MLSHVFYICHDRGTMDTNLHLGQGFAKHGCLTLMLTAGYGLGTKLLTFLGVKVGPRVLAH